MNPIDSTGNSVNYSQRRVSEPDTPSSFKVRDSGARRASVPPPKSKHINSKSPKSTVTLAEMEALRADLILINKQLDQVLEEREAFLRKQTEKQNTLKDAQTQTETQLEDVAIQTEAQPDAVRNNIPPKLV